MDVITPAIMLIPAWSAPAEPGLSNEAIEEFLVCLDDRDPTEPALSRSPPKYLPSSLAFLFSFLCPLEKNDLPPEDCRDLLSGADMIGSQTRRLNHRYEKYGGSLVLVQCA